MSENMKIQKPEEILHADLEAIYIGNLNTVDDDLMLPQQGKYGSKLRWKTGEERFIEANGTVHRPLHGMGNRKVLLTVTAEYEGMTESREFEATVVQEAKKNDVTKIRMVEVKTLVGCQPPLPSVVIVNCADGRQTTLPVVWDNFEIPREETVIEVEGSVEGTKKKALARIRFLAEMTVEKGPERKGEFFPLNQVRLLPGTVYYEYQERMKEYLLSVNDDQMLYNFRRACGLDVKGAQPMTGWDEDSCKLKGHTTGHYLSGLALAWATGGEQTFLNKINYMVDSLGECQHAFATSGKYQEGFLSAYSEEQFDLLEKFTKYPEIWAPYYTLDKIMSGLYDCHQLAGNAKALEILTKMGDWVYDRLSCLPKETLNKMWSMYIAGEYGGMLGTMVKLYQLTGSEKHLKAARLFLNEKLFYPMEQNCDTLEDMHANQHIPQIMGAMNLYQTTGETKFWTIARNFWEMVTGGHIYCIGGVGETEMFHAANSTHFYLTDKTAESCASYNMLRLTGQIFLYSMDGSMMDYYENTLLNHIMTSCSHTSDGGTTYFLPLEPGGVKEYSTTENSCCHGTGMESRFRYMEHIYACDYQYVYVNLPVDSVLTGEIALTLKTLEVGKFSLQIQKDMTRKLRVHVPAWAQEKLTATCNGRVLEKLQIKQNYLELPEILKAGDEVILQLPIKLRVLKNRHHKSLVNVAYGYDILAAISPKKEFLKVPELSDMKQEGRLFAYHDMELIPVSEVDREAYHVYFKK